MLEHWQTEHGLENLSPETLAPYFERVERNLSIHENEPHEVNYNGRLLLEGAKKLGIPASPTSRNVKDCALSGHCISACKTDRKQSMLVTYLPWASELGATILSGTRAERFEVRDRRVTRRRSGGHGRDGQHKPVRVEAGSSSSPLAPFRPPFCSRRTRSATAAGRSA